MDANKKLISQMIQVFVTNVFSERLKEEGFVSRNGENLHWYRVVNREIVQTIYFNNRCRYLAATVDVGYGCHPLFTEPLFPTNALIPRKPANYEVYFEYPNGKCDVHSVVFSKDCLVMHPADEYKGLDLLEERVLSKFNSISTIEGCYLNHRDFWFGKSLENLWWNQMLLPTFFDEVIWVEDKAVYPRCLQRIEDYQSVWKDPGKEYSGYLKQMEPQKSIFQGGERAEYIALLQKRAETTLRKIERLIGKEVHCIR